jgi:hypothetical protein
VRSKGTCRMNRQGDNDELTQVERSHGEKRFFKMRRMPNATVCSMVAGRLRVKRQILLRGIAIIGLTRQVQVDGRPDVPNISNDKWNAASLCVCSRMQLFVCSGTKMLTYLSLSSSLVVPLNTAARTAKKCATMNTDRHNHSFIRFSCIGGIGF